MHESILDNVKKILGLAPEYKAFDVDVLTHINSTLSVLSQLGVLEPGGFTVLDDTAVWGDLKIPEEQLNATRTYVFLKVRMLFDPPTTSFHIEAMKNQILELEWRLNVFREETQWSDPFMKRA